MNITTIARTTAVLLAAFVMTATFAAQPSVRVIHASPDAPAVDILVNDEIRAFESVPFGEITDSAMLDANVYNVKVVPAGAGPDAAVINADLNLKWFKSYTVLAVGPVAEIAPLVIADPATQIILPERAWLRFVHASPDAPAVDLRVAGGPFLFQNVSFTEIADYIEIPAGATVDVEVLIAGTESVVLVVPGVSLEEGKAYTAYATGFAAGEPSLGALLSEDGGTGFPIRLETRPGGEGSSDDDDEEETEFEVRDDEDDDDDINDFLDRLRLARERFGR